MKKLKELVFVYACVTTCVVFVTALYITIFWPHTTLGVELLWQILAVSLLTSLGFYIYPEQEVSAKATWLLCVLHYVEVNVVVLGCGSWFGWFRADDLPMVLGMVIIIAFVFVLVSKIMWNRKKKMAALMNERLREYQRNGSREGAQDE